MLRNMRAFLKRSPYKFAVGGTLTAFAVYNIPKSDCAPKDKENKDDSISSFIGGILGSSGEYYFVRFLYRTTSQLTHTFFYNWPDNSNNGGKKPDPIGELLNQYMPQIQQVSLNLLNRFLHVTYHTSTYVFDSWGLAESWACAPAWPSSDSAMKPPPWWALGLPSFRP